MPPKKTQNKQNTEVKVEVEIKAEDQIEDFKSPVIKRESSH